jgi:hypothetical protein
MKEMTFATFRDGRAGRSGCSRRSSSWPDYSPLRCRPILFGQLNNIFHVQQAQADLIFPVIELRLVTAPESHTKEMK